MSTSKQRSTLKQSIPTHRATKQSTLVKAGLAVGAMACCAPASALDFEGYFRALAGSNSSKGGATCFQLSGTLAKYRLGNECEVYGEFTFSQAMAKADDGAVFSTVVMLSYYSPNASSSSDADLPQVYVQGAAIPELNGGTVWMGRKYYKRESISDTDFMYWSGRGFGGGIEDISVGGDLKFSYALLRKDNLVATTSGLLPATGALKDNGSNSATRHDFQLRGIPTNSNGSLELGMSVIVKDAKGNAETPADTLHSGYGATIQHRQVNINGDGVNKFAIQYGKGPGTGGSDASVGAIGNLTDDKHISRLRLVEGLYTQFTPRLGVELIGVYQKDKGFTAERTELGVAENKVWTSVGTHVVYGISRRFKLAMDLGHDTVRPDDGPTRRMTKFTIAPTLSSGPGMSARPDLRLFYTYAKWNDAARLAADNANPGSALSSTGAFGAASSGSMVGVQADVSF